MSLGGCWGPCSLRGFSGGGVVAVETIILSGKDASYEEEALSAALRLVVHLA